MSKYIATCNSYSDRLYKKDEIVDFEGAPPSKHFKLIEGELPAKQKLSDIVPLGFVDKSVAELKELAKLKGLSVPGNIGKEKLISMILTTE